MAGVTLQNVTKRFGDVTVVTETSLEIQDGEFLVLVGPSGCGKTTTLRMVAGLETPTTGDIFIGERKVTKLEPKDRDIAMVFQSYALYPHMNIFDNLAFGLRLKKTAEQEIGARVKQAAELLGLGDYLKRFPKQLSGGQRQRVALGRAIVRDPQVFLMDEPLSNLDAKLRVQTRAEIIKLHQRMKATFIYVTHDQTEAMTMGTRIVVMKDGSIQQVGAPHEIFDQPQNVFVAGFIGSPQMNFIEGFLTHRDGRLIFNGQGLCWSFPLEQEHMPQQKEVILGIRPESLCVNDVQTESEDMCASLLVEVVENIGSETMVHGKAENGQEIVIKMPNYRRIPAVGSTVGVLPKRGNIHLFDKQTGGRILTKRYDASGEEDD